MDLGAPVLEYEAEVVIENNDKLFTEAQDKVYTIDYDETAEDKAWDDSYITWNYEPVTVIEGNETTDDESETTTDGEKQYE